MASDFDMDIFMRVCGWHPWTYGNDPKESSETLWWNHECMTFGRVGDQFFCDDIDDWERMDAFFEKYPEASITDVSHTPWHPVHGDNIPRKGYFGVHIRLTAPWPTSFDEAWDLMKRWGCDQDEEDREQLRKAYERMARISGQRANRKAGSQKILQKGGEASA
jgi:hypothetical protein